MAHGRQPRPREGLDHPRIRRELGVHVVPRRRLALHVGVAEADEEVVPLVAVLPPVLRGQGAHALRAVLDDGPQLLDERGGQRLLLSRSARQYQHGRRGASGVVAVWGMGRGDMP